MATCSSCFCRDKSLLIFSCVVFWIIPSESILLILFPLHLKSLLLHSHMWKQVYTWTAPLLSVTWNIWIQLNQFLNLTDTEKHKGGAGPYCFIQFTNVGKYWCLEDTELCFPGWFSCTCEALHFNSSTVWAMHITLHLMCRLKRGSPTQWVTGAWWEKKLRCSSHWWMDGVLSSLTLLIVLKCRTADVWFPSSFSCKCLLVVPIHSAAEQFKWWVKC